MNLLTYSQHVAISSIAAYFFAKQIRDPLTRPSVLARFQIIESGSVPLLEALSQRAAAEGDEWLAKKLAKHAAEETKHCQIFASALKQLGKQAIGFKGLLQDTAKSQSDKQDDPFVEAYFEGYSLEGLKSDSTNWSMFLASSYILELDSSKEFARLAKVLPEDEPTSRNLKKGLLIIANDEKEHAAYLYEAMTRRMPATKVQKLVDEWRERKVNAMLALISSLLPHDGQMSSLVKEQPAERANEGIG